MHAGWQFSTIAVSIDTYGIYIVLGVAQVLRRAIMDVADSSAPAFVRCEALDERAAIAEYETAVAIPALEDEHLECSICREQVVWSNHVRLPCGHAFDGHCLRSWFISRVREDKACAEFTCPMCRADCRIEVAGTAAI